MNDLRLVAARKLVWDRERQLREPAHRAFIVRTLEDMIALEEHTSETRAEIEMLIKKLRGFD